MTLRVQCVAQREARRRRRSIFGAHADFVGISWDIVGYRWDSFGEVSANEVRTMGYRGGEVRDVVGMSLGYLWDIVGIS